MLYIVTYFLLQVILLLLVLSYSAVKSNFACKKLAQDQAALPSFS